jgi:acetyl esterase/lipase
MRWLKRLAGAILLLALIFVGGSVPLAPDLTSIGLLSGADRMTGGGIGVERAGQGVSYGTHDQRLDIWRPSAAAPARPVVVFFHGGAWRNGSAAAYGFAGRALARLGYIAIVPDYRKLPVHPFPAFMEDAAQVLAWTRRNIAAMGGDPDRIALVGHSSGAHMTLLLALDHRWLAEAHVPPQTIRAVIGISGPYDFYPYSDEAARLAFGDTPAQLTQPVRLARRDAPPTLLFASRSDTRVKPRNSIALARQLRAKGAPARLVLLDGLSHEATLLSLMRQLAWLGPVRAQSGAFLAQSLSRPAQP